MFFCAVCVPGALPAHYIHDLQARSTHLRLLCPCARVRVCEYVHARVRAGGRAGVRACMCACVCACVHACVRELIAHMWVHKCVCICAYVVVYVHLNMCMCACARMCAHARESCHCSVTGSAATSCSCDKGWEEPWVADCSGSGGSIEHALQGLSTCQTSIPELYSSAHVAQFMT